MENVAAGGTVVYSLCGSALHDVILVLASLVEGQNAIKGHIAVCIVGAGQHGVGGTVVVNIEGESACGQGLAGQVLLDRGIQLHRHILRVIGIDKGDGAIVSGNRCLLAGDGDARNSLDGHGGDQVAIVLGDGDSDMVLGIGVAPAVAAASDLGDQVVVNTGVGVGCSEAGFAGCIGVNGQHSAACQRIPIFIGLHSGEGEACLGDSVITGVVHHFLGHVNADGCGVIGVGEGDFIGAIGDGRVIQVRDRGYQLAAVIGDGDSEGIQSAVIGQIFQASLDLQHLVGPGAGEGVGNALQHIFDQEGFGAALAGSIGGHSGGHIHPCAAIPLLHQEGEGTAIEVGILLCLKNLGACNVQIHRGGLGGIFVGDDRGCVGTGRNGNSAVGICVLTGVIAGAISGGKDLRLCIGQFFRNTHLDALRQVKDLNSLPGLDGQIQITCGIHRFGGDSLTAGVIQITLLHGEALACQHSTHIDRKVESLCLHAIGNGMIAGHFLGNVEIAILVRRVGHGGGHILGRAGQDLAQRGDDNGSSLGFDVVIAVDHFPDGTFRSGGNAADVHGFAGFQVHGQNVVAVGGDGRGNIVAVGVLDHRRSGYIGRNGNRQGVGIIGIADSLRNRLGQGDAGGDGGGQLTVVAQPNDHVVVAVVGSSCIGILGLITNFGRSGCIGFLGHRHVMQTAGTQGAHTQHSH